MKTNKFGEIILDQDDLCDLIMKDHKVWELKDLKVDHNLSLEKLISLVENPSQLMTWSFPENSDISVTEFDYIRQNRWFVPEEYQTMDIAAYVLDLCRSQEELQRCGQELMLYQERNLFDLLRFLKYLVDVMHDNQVIWGVGRGSSVASYVLYKMGVHRINSLYYDLDPSEFLR